MIGFVIGGQLLKVDTNFIIDTESTSSSLQVGAWWPGFLITCIGGLLCGILMFCFPDSLKNEEEGDQEKTSLSVRELSEHVLRKVYFTTSSFLLLF